MVITVAFYGTSIFKLGFYGILIISGCRRGRCLLPEALPLRPVLLAPECPAILPLLTSCHSLGLHHAGHRGAILI